MNEKELHDIAVGKIAQEMFAFPKGEVVPGIFHPTWVLYTNIPERKMPVEHKWKGNFYPDIVIVDSTKCNAPKLIAEVETKESLTVDDALEQRWMNDKDECSVLFVFVPEGTARKAANMVLDYKMGVPTGMYTYGFDKEGKIRITPV